MNTTVNLSESDLTDAPFDAVVNTHRDQVLSILSSVRTGATGLAVPRHAHRLCNLARQSGATAAYIDLEHPLHGMLAQELRRIGITPVSCDQ